MKERITIVISAIVTVAVLCLGYVGMEKRHVARSERASEDAGEVVAAIKANPMLTNLTVSTSIAGSWFMGESNQIHVYGTAQSQTEIDRLRSRVNDLELSFPVQWETQLAGEPQGEVVAHPSAWWENLMGTVIVSLVRYWGLSPLFFPAILIALFGIVKSVKRRRVLHALLLAWSLWVLCLTPIVDGFWYWPSVLDGLLIVLPAVVAWTLVARAQSRRKERQIMRLLLPCAIPILADVLYSPINAGYLADRFGCGCNLEGVNANHITFFFFVFVWIVTLISTGVVSRQDSLRFRMIHLAVVGGFTFWLCRQAMLGNIYL